MNNTTFANGSDTSNSTTFTYTFEEFSPVLAQCYLIVAVGYLVARFQLLSAADLRGASAFVTYVGMPGIICVTLADSDLSNLRWELLFSLFLGKFLVFVMVAALTFLVTDNIGVAGLLAVFCVHSNDLPVGNPLLSAIYRNYRPEMMNYLFLMPVITMVIFMPMGHFMIALHKKQQLPKKKLQSNQQGKEIGKWTVSRREFLAVYQSLLKSAPVVIATVVGIIFNVIFHNNMHQALHQPLTVVAATVPGMVLNILGFCFVRKERYLITSVVVTASLLLVVKMFITPIILHTITRLLAGDSESSKTLSDFSLLYGIVSPATVIFLSGQEFRKPLAAMSSALIITSLLSFPASFVIAQFTVVTVKDLNEYVPLLRTVMFWIACICIPCDIFVWISTGRKKAFTKFPYCYISCLVLSQILTSCGIIFWCVDTQKQWIEYCKTILYYGGEISSYIWTGTLAVVYVSSKSKTSKNRFVIVTFITYSICFMVTALMCVLVSYNDDERIFFAGLPRTGFEFFQLQLMTVLLICSLAVVCICLCIQFKKSLKYNVIKKSDFDNPAFYLDEEIAVVQYKKKRSSTLSIHSYLSEKNEEKLYYEEMINNSNPEVTLESKEEWTFRYFSLLLLYMLIMFIRLVSNLYKIGKSDAREVMIPLEFLQSTLFAGQGIVLFMTFGIDVRTISIRVMKWLRRKWYGNDNINVDLSTMDDNTAIVLFCNKFQTYYFSHCLHMLGKDRRWKLAIYKNSFWGHQLVDWMIEEGLAQDEIEAEELGQKLHIGGIIRHVTNSHHFHDAPYLYHFIKKEEDISNAG